MLVGPLSTGPPAAGLERGPGPLGVTPERVEQSGAGQGPQAAPDTPQGSHPSLPQLTHTQPASGGILPPLNEKLCLEGASSGLKTSATPSNIQVRGRPPTCHHGAQGPLHEK